MRVPLSWLREWVDVPADVEAVSDALTRAGIEVDRVVDLGSTVTGPLVVGRVLAIEELTGLKKPIRYCQVDVGEGEPRGIICGATNFAAADLVVVALPGTVLPGDFAISARKTYGRISDGMICSARELGIGDDHSGIIVLRDVAAGPGDAARPLVGLDDVILDLEVTPDRGYCLSVRGLARELSHALGVPFRDPAGAVEGAPATEQPPYAVSVEDTLGCDRFAARLVRGIDPHAPTPAPIRQRLAAAGIRSISLAVDITNYLMVELGQPMHAFDPNRLSGPLVVRRGRAGERLTTLDGVDRALDPEDMVICDDTGPVSLAAVMGGENSEMLPDSVDVLFEAAHWDAAMVSRTARRHRLFSEAAKRWERGVDPQLALAALEKAVRLLIDHAGGELDPRVLDLDAVAPPVPVAVPVELPSRVVGVPYPATRVVEVLTEIGCAVEVSGESLLATPPSWRPDLRQAADFVEEVVRLDGYGKVPSALPLAPPGRGLTPRQRRRRGVGRALAENGYVEVLSHPFVSATVLAALQLPDGASARGPAFGPDQKGSVFSRTVQLVNPLSDEESVLRPTLLASLLVTLKRNLGRGLRDLALYELSPVVRRRDATGTPPALPVTRRPDDADLAAAELFVPDQPWHAAAVLTGDAEPAGWWGGGRPVSWADAVEAARITVAAAGWTAEVRAATQAPWHPGRCAEILVEGRVVGYAGELHPAVCAALDLPRRTAAMELDLDAVPLPAPVLAPRISGYPPALLDVALVVPARTPAGEVEAALVEGAGELLESVRLFDVYRSEQLGADRTSLAYKLTFRAADRTLTVEEAIAARDAAVALAADRFGATLRGA